MTKNYFGGLKAEIKTPEQGILLFWQKKSPRTGGILRQRCLFRIIPWNEIW
jgi:hypothetical protein